MAKDYKTIYFDNYDTDEILSREDFEYQLKDRFSEEEIEDFSESEKNELYWDDYYEYENEYFNNSYEALKEYFNEKNVIAKISFGRWNGASNGLSMINYGDLSDYNDFDTFFRSFLKDCEYYKIGITKDNKIFIQATHHDGTNYTELKEVTEKGSDLYEGFYHENRLANYTEKEVLNKIWKSKVYSSKLEKDFNLYDYL